MISTRLAAAIPALLALLTAAFSNPLAAQEPAANAADDLVGSWQGDLAVGAHKLKLALHVEAAAPTGAYTGTFDSLSQGAKGIPIATITRDGTHVVLDVRAIRGTYDAELEAADGDTPARLVGTWSQGGRDFELTMTAVDAIDEPKRPQHPQPPFPYAIEDVTFSHAAAANGDEVTLAGTLTLPAGDGPHACAVLITGSGQQDRDETILGHKPFWVLADHLTRAGLAVLRYDDRGVGESTGNFGTATSADFADDVRAALRYLSTRDDIDAARLGLIGHSEGGLIAPLVASDGGDGTKRVAFAVLLAPPAVNIRDVILHQSRIIAAEQGATPEDLDANERLMRAAFDAVANHDDADERRAALRAAAEATWKTFSEEFREAAGPIDDVVGKIQSLGQPWMLYLLGVDPTDALRKMRCDVLAVFGGKDLQVDPAQNLEPLRQAFADREDGVAIEVLENHNHLFQRTTSGAPTEYGELEETFSPIALDLVERWITEHVLDG